MTDADESAVAVEDDTGGETRHKDVCLVTGASSGIGRATALAFLAEDWVVYASAREPDDVAELADAGCRTVELDVTDDEQVAAVVERVVDEQGRIDCVVNNAGFAQFGPLEDVSTAAMERQFDVNAFGPHRLVRAALPHMREAGDGTIVNVSSVVGELSLPGSGAYAASKAAVESMSDALRAEVEEYGVDVAVVAPGPVESSFYDRADQELEATSRSGAYEDIYELYDDAASMGGFGPASISPAMVADAIVNAASATDPAPRYPVGPVAKYSGLVRFVPKRLRDRVFGLARRLFA
ncbi:SDR family oxidoreductase [Halorubellus sp. PRR65]|uniref:SDR family oxidoreductase n=1 Tax=Halorubellus sp. PRR65 TaxID=3098148 RepID=UPI002B258F00|nr:SDR family oxidoreductase [Halorubellus sp. PRR65]